MTFNFRLENCRCSRLFNLPAESCTKHVCHRRGFQNAGHRRNYICISRAGIKKRPALQAINFDCLFNWAHRSGQFLRCRPVSVNRVGSANACYREWFRFSFLWLPTQYRFPRCCRFVEPADPSCMRRVQNQFRIVDRFAGN